MPNYVIISGGAYQPGSAAAKKAQELVNTMPPAPSNSVPFPSTPAPPATGGASTLNFPSYLTSAMGTMSSTATGGSPSLAGAPATAGRGAYGLVPQAPNPISTAAGSIAGNTANLPGLTTLGTDTTTLNANLGQLPYQLNLPGYGGLIGSASENIQSNLKGIVDPQEWQQLQQHAGERGAIMGITPGSPNFNTALLTALDQSIAGRQNLGQQQLNAAIGRTPTGQPFNTAGQQIGPGDVQSAQWLANQLAGAPDPTLAAQANLDSLLKAIEAGKNQFGGVPSLPPARTTAPGMPQMPYFAPSLYGQTPLTPVSSGWGTTPTLPTYGPTAPGQNTGYVYQNPTTDYSVAPGGGQYPIDMTDYLNNFDLGIDSSLTPGGTPYPVVYDQLP